MYELPTSIFIDEKEYPIRKNGDYRVVLDCFKALEDIELPDQFRVFTALIVFLDGIDTVEDIINEFGDNIQTAVEEMYLFFNCGEKNIGMNTNRKLIDWESDSQMIFAAINNVARSEIRSVPFVHWWTFMGYFCSVGESTLATVVNIRNKIIKGKKLEKYEREFKRENPQYFNWRSKTAQQIEEEQAIMALWNKDK